MAVDQQVYRGFVAPLADQVITIMRARRPILHWIANALYKIFVPKTERENIVARLKADYRSPEAFEKVNTYRFLSLKRLSDS
jgi:hypothetical protein